MKLSKAQHRRVLVLLLVESYNKFSLDRGYMEVVYGAEALDEARWQHNPDYDSQQGDLFNED